MFIKNTIKYFFVAATVAVGAGSCEVDPAIVEELPANDIRFFVPEGWPYPNYDFTGNSLTKDGFILGRKLFFEPKLSRDNSISCGSCHQQFAAFANLDHPVSHGVDDLLGNRNAPGLYNLNWHTSFMWDGGINHIEVQPIGPITNPVEMDESIANVVAKIQADPSYPPMFKAAFGSETINSQLIFKAITQFQGMLISCNSKYDLYKRGAQTLTASEQNGENLFMAKCNVCHTAPLFSNFEYKNNGLDSVFTDAGRATITLAAADSGKFKVPSLRNVALTREYMHDGRFTTLDQAVEHYNSGVKNSSTLSPEVAGGIPLTASEKADLIAFLKTLSDPSFIHDARFKDPFAP